MKTKNNIIRTANSKITQHLYNSNIITGVFFHRKTIGITHSKTTQLRITGTYLYEKSKEW